MYKIGILSTHPIQYYSPFYRKLSETKNIDLTVYYCHMQSSINQAENGFITKFNWDIPILEGYNYKFLKNVSKNPNVNKYFGCDTPEIIKIIKDNNFDAFIVHGWYVKSFLQAIYSCWISKTPIYVRGDSHLKTKRSLLKKLFKYPLYRLLIPIFDGYLIVGKKSREYLKYYGANEKYFYFSPHSVDNEFFNNYKNKYLPISNKIKKDFNIPLNSIVFVFVGKLVDEKRPMDFVNAIKISQRINSNIHGLIVGDGLLFESIKETIKNDNIQITLTGFLNQTQIPKAYTISNMIVMPSQGETWGLVINEAMASGLPALVSSQVGCADDLIIKNITGETFTVGNVQELSDLLVKYSLKSDKLEVMGKNSLKHINNYSIEKSIKGVIQILDRK